MRREADLEPMWRDWCDECGTRHSPERRRAIILRMLPATPLEVSEAWPHFWPTSARGTASQRRLVRDLRAAGAAHGEQQGSPWEVAP